jgi:hypothetical protein
MGLVGDFSAFNQADACTAPITVISGVVQLSVVGEATAQSLGGAVFQGSNRRWILRGTRSPDAQQRRE